MCPVLSPSFSNGNTKILFTPWKLGLIKKSKYWFRASIDVFDWYLFQLIVLLKPDFNCCNSFALSRGEKVSLLFLSAAISAAFASCPTTVILP